ncbi:MAG: SPOR domain-containing protein, partial [Acidobacteriota bacterium]|nr:SPOR domain-containing protein [Acidobacteriota bacterium]
AFPSRENSLAAVHELEGRGYQPYVVDQAQRRHRTLHLVRIGRYPDREAALSAAATFRQREKRAAIVERAGEL